ncbi:MAG: hypothetical protein J6K25_11650 [Thermoguttaceae bacterium]|nr:hypothetical protein [Thermoguttaceae bacterium]
MKRRNHTERRGVALLLILTLLAMFAVSVLAFMTITSNMADTAQNAAKAERYLPPTAQEDVGAALRNVLIGSNNERNPIGPFGVLENMYGDWKEYNISYDNNGVPTGASENASVQFEANIAIFPNRGYAVLTPDVQNHSWGNIKDYFERSGGVMTFSDALFDDADAEAVWNDVVSGSSTFVLEKVITNPTAPLYKNAGMVAPDAGTGLYWFDHYYMAAYDDAGDQNNYKIWDNWHFRVELSDDLKRFVADLRDAAARNGADPDAAVDAFNESLPLVTARLNRPVYSGTGVGGFTPMEAKDAQITPEMLGNSNIAAFGGDALRIPFAFWTNAAAPDLVPYRRGPSSTLSFRSMWAHLTDWNYDAAQPELSGSRDWRYAWFDGGVWRTNPVAYGYQDGAYLEPPRLAAPYTAADRFTLFLANYKQAPFIDSGVLNDDLLNNRDETVTPSFHRPALFQTLCGWNGGTNYLSFYDQAYDAGNYDEAARGALLTALLRKLTPRPLPLDHWNFDGGNDRLRYVNPENPLPNRVEGFANALATDAPAANPYDVDADGDGVREAIWIPSGLPIRVDENGTPYATMFAYTILDLDGRVNVNTAGNWDQLPNRARTAWRFFPENADNFEYDAIDDENNMYKDVAHPYNYVDELAAFWAEDLSGGLDSPFYNVANLTGRFQWRDDGDGVVKIATRGEGRGTSNVQLYETLSHLFTKKTTRQIETIAANLLWRRNLSQLDAPTGVVDQSGLVWDLNNKHDDKAQPGARINGNETDDAFATRYNFFRFFDPIRLYDPNDPDANEADAKLARTKMIFPWRGKTTLDAGAYSMLADLVPRFDFADTGFRSYDPLGAQIYTYAPQYSRNPYWARQNGLGWADSPYSLPMLERLLRPFDADAANLPSQLVDDLGMNSDLFDGATDDISRTERLIAEAQRADARLALTTLSSDAPSPSLVFPDNTPLEEGQFRGGSFGFEDLIRRNVRAELTRVFKNKGIDVDWMTSGPSYDVFEDKVDEISAYLIAMLPPEIAAGKKIDLNALARKNYWNGVEYDENVDQFVSNFDAEFATETSDGAQHYRRRADGSDMHNLGLVKRMEMARGLYLVVMTLLYEDMNAGTLYNDGLPFTVDTDGDNVFDAVDPAELLSDYVEGSFDLLKFDGDNRKEANGVVSRQLIATRVAQWCVNVVDFADPDATMTPFFFDPTPFDGWWVENDWISAERTQSGVTFNPWEAGRNDYSNAEGEPVVFVNPGWAGVDPPEIRFLFAPRNGVPTELMAAFFRNAFNNSYNEQTAEPSGYRNADGFFPEVKTVDDAGVETTTNVDRRANELIAEWMSREIKSVKDQAGDLGFRLAWGMERPDLVLTETLSFHDLGIADTKEAHDVADGASDEESVAAGGSDPHFDQVKRPEGSTYLELYCAANPNVPQSTELYTFDENTKQWRLRLTKRTPVYTDSLGRELEMPIWRVAISESRDPRGLNVPEDGANDDAKKENARSKAAVYRKGRNGVLDWLASGKKDGNRFPDNDFSFFSMQTRQFRNLPTPGELEVASIADLDLYQGYDEANNKAKEPNAAAILADWKAFNLRSSNILGPAFAASQDSRVDSVNGKRADAWSLREVEIDRILWFCKAEGDAASEATKLGTAGKYPDALRTFCNAEGEAIYLAPNEYLVVGPDKKRSLGSVTYDTSAEETDDCRFGVKPLDSDSASWINIDNGRHGDDSLTNAGTENLSQAGKPAPNYKYMVAVANIGGRGLNISEPLWTATGVDPYYENQAKKIDPANKIDKDRAEVLDVRDVPFEMPKTWGDRGTEDANFYDNKVANYPIVQDKLFGVGTVPAYKSAFVQRVADPNRPYHPLMNPYITVDWNAMDLTVFTGEAVTDLEYECSRMFAKENEDDGGAKTDFDDKNQIELAENKAVGGDKTTFPYADAFSSRQWGNSKQRMFLGGLRDDGKIRPNVWDRGVRLGDGGASAGLEKPNDWVGGGVSTGRDHAPALKYIPRHTLGFYNNRGPLGTTDDASGEFIEGATGLEYKGLSRDYDFRKNDAVATVDLPYRAAPRTPFEHLVWNDAPYDNPFELALVPASAPGRFGLEFIRVDEQFNLSKLYNVEKSDERRKRGKSLGSEGVFGFGEWYAKADDVDGELKRRAGKIGPYLNFFGSSKRPGESLNLCRALEFVYTPSLFLGTQNLAGEDENGNLITDGDGNPVFYSARREPGKINLNTTTEPGLKALSPRSDRVSNDAKLPGTPWRSEGSDDGFFDVRNNAIWTRNVGDTDGDGTEDFQDENRPNAFVPFQPAHTTPLWGQLDQSPAPLPISATLAAQNETRSDDRGTNGDPLFDNLRERYATDGGAKVYSYRDDEGNIQTTTDLDWLIANDVAYEEFKLLGKRNNLFEATAEMQRLSGTTTNRSNVFAIWTTVGYFEVERCNPGVNMPSVDPDGNELTLEKLIDPNYKWYRYYQAIYPDGYTYGKELGAEFGETKRRRGFAIIDRSIPVDFRRGQSANYQDAILLQRVLD